MKKVLDQDDPPRLTGEELKHPKGKWRIGRKSVSAEEGMTALRAALKRKTRVNIHLDNDSIAHYKKQAGGRGYQTLINAAVRRDRERASIEKELRAMVREELRAVLSEELDKKFAQYSAQTAALVAGTKSELSVSGHFSTPSTGGEQLKLSATGSASTGAHQSFLQSEQLN